MATKKNVETNKKNTEVKSKKSNEIEQKTPKLKKKLRLHSHLKVNIPLFQSLMMILPSLAKHAAADGLDNSGDTADQVAANSVTEKDVTDDPTKADSSAVTYQEAQTSDSDVNSPSSESHAPYASNSHLVPSHHLSTLSHPQVHYIPSVSMPTISSESNGQPTHSTTPPTPTLPVTFKPEVIKGTYGELHVDANGQYTFVLNPNSPQYILLNQHQQGTDHFLLHLSNGSSVIVQVPVTGKQDTPSISGDLTGVVTEDHNIDSQGLLHANGKIDVIDPDQNESSVKPEVISGKYGSLTIDADGHWQYQVDNSLSNVQALTAATSLHESFTIHTKDGTPQTIDMTIGGNDDNAVITGVDAGTVTEDLTTQVQGQLSVTDSDLGEDHFQASQVNGHLGTLTISKDGSWTYDLDNTNPKVQALGQGSTATDTITVHSADGTPHQITITVNGSNNSAIITDTQTNLNARGVTEDRGYIDTHYQLHYDGQLNIQDPDAGEAKFDPNIGPQTYQGIGYDTKLGGHVLLMRDGHYTYTLDNRNIQNLAEGEVKQDSVVIRSLDGTTHTIELTVHGTNDKPTIAAQSQSVTEGGSVLKGQMVGHDIDTGATLTYSAPQIDGLVVNPDGSYSFNPAHSTYQSLASGVTKTLTVPVTVTDEHNASSTQNLSITITGVNNSAVIGGVDTGDVIEGTAGQNMSPDYAQPLMSTLGRAPLYASGALTITDADSGETTFDSRGLGFNYAGKFGDLLLREDGTWSYYADAGNIRIKGGITTNRGSAIDQLGEGEVLTDTITIYSKDGTSHDVVITIHGSNDRPYCSSEVQLNSGKEDLAQTITATELLANTVDVDANDAGKLTIANLHADHGSIQDNHDGTFTFTPSHNYNGSVHFTYDVKDAHGGTTHTGASTSLVATPDKAIISEVTTGSVIEDGPHATHNNGTTTELANGQLQVIDPDSGEDKFQYSQFGETRIHDPFGGMLRIDSAGNWGYSVDNAALQHLAQGQVETVTYRVHSFDGTAYDLNIDVVGTNDAPTVSKVVLSNGTEDTHYQMQASQFGFTDVDTGDTLHSIAIIDLPPAAQGKFVLDGHDITAGQSITTADIAKLQFVPAPDFNGDVQFKFTVNDGHTDSQKATNTLHIDAVSDAAKIAGTDTGDVHEGHTYTAPDGTMSGGSVDDRSPDHMHGNIGKLWNDEIHTDGHLTIIDTDTGESHAQNGIYQGSHGQVILQSNGDWSYYASIGQDATGRQIDRLGQGESITDTVTVKSADGTTHDIHITIHGDNDRPYCSSEVQLNSGKEDLAQTITTTELLANTVDVDTNDSGKLSIANLHADHGSIATNSDGSFSYTPEKDYNGQVHFTYDVKDGHGGITHTGATTSLAAVNDNPDVTPITDSITEDTDSHHSVNLLGTATDVDGDPLAISQIQVTFEGDTGPLPVGVGIAPDGHTLIIDSHSSAFQHLSAGQKSDLTVHYMVDDNHGGQTPAIATITMVGTDDKATLASNVIQMTETQALDSAQHAYGGRLQLVDPDTGDNTQFVFSGQYIGQGYAPGTFDIWPDGSYQFRLQGALNRHADDLVASLHAGESKDFPYEIKTSDGQTLTVMVKVTGEDSNAQIHVSMPNSLPANQSVTEEHFVPASATNLYAGGRLQVVDPDHDQSYLQAETINTAHHGQFKISANGGWSYTIDNSIDTVQKLGAGESFTETHTVHSLDGTASQLLTVTVQGTNDAPVVSAAVKLAPGIEDTDIQLNKSDLLSNATDIDHNDIGHLNITNLVANHGVIVDNKDGTFNFHPESNYNGQVHFSYDVIDGHGGVAHTSASTTLAAVNDAAVFSVDDTGSVQEDVHVQGDAQHTVAVSGVLIVSDPDAGESEFVASRNVHAVNDQFGGGLSIGRAGDWTYSVPNNNLNRLAEGEKHQVTYEVFSRGGDKHQIVITVVGTNDEPFLSVTQITPTTGTLTETDVDANDTHTFSVVSSTGQFGSLSVDPDSGAYVYTANGSVAGMSYNAATHTYHGTDVFEVKVADNHGGESSKFITFDANGHVSVVPGQQPTISTTVPVNPQITTAQPSLPTGTNTPPNNAVTVDLAASSDTGTSDTDNLTKDSTPTITGHTDIPYSQVTIYDGSTPIGHAVSDGSGQYSVAVSSLSNGDHNLSAKALAPSSVLPATSSLLAIHVDTVVTPLTIGLTHDTGSNTSDLITSDGALTIGGQEAGATIEYSTDNGHTWTSSFTPQQGTNTVSVRQTDTAGNVSASTSLNFTLDTQIHVGIHTNPITADNVVNAQESNSSVDITGTVSGDFNAGDIVTLDVNGKQHTGVVDAKGRYSIAVPGSELLADADQKIEASIAVTDSAGNSAHATADVTYQVDTQASVPTITFENAGADNLYSKAEIARGHANTITATVTPPGDAKIGEHLVVNGQDHVLDAHSLQHGIQIEVHPGSNVQATMTDEHGNTAGSQGFAASAIPEPIIVRPPSGSHQVSGTLGVPPLLPSLTPVPTAQSGWRIHLPSGQYVTSHHGQYGTLTIDPQTGHLHYQEQAQVHTGPHGSASGIGQHEDKFEVALQGTNQDEVVAHVNIQILSHGPGHSGKLNIGTEVVDMTITPIAHSSHPAPPPPPPVQHDEPDMASQADFTVTQSDDSYLDLTQHAHQEPDQKTSHHGAAAYLDALGIKPDATSTTVHDQPADMDIVLAQVDQPDAVTHDQAHLDMSDALEHHDANINHNQDDEHHHHNDVDGLPDIDPNS
ncbi:VCBS domain-containing protein [Vibrio sp. 10N.261.55.A7]|uniref:VCBS domain-containing protein n=1 Tax=Vibrio sp. 10N.261.55.A7 TaxID=1880851 RepID=UPI000C816398|nr:VCBS domain-containing protein [Vibrio sp. 10N.261.55.A7]PMJ92777.1 hypothetical protein BCU12_07115 [Vibrio sp. 10N.261.55.A7]